MRSIIVVMALVVILASCSQPDDSEELIEGLVYVRDSYERSNPSFFSEYSSGFVVDLSDRDHCLYAELFHELRLIGNSLDESCVSPRFAKLVLTPINGSSPMALFGFNSTLSFDQANYDGLEEYSLVLIYAFGSEADSERFSSDTLRLVLETYESDYVPMGSLDMPRLSSRPAFLEFVGYARSVAPFIESGDEVGLFHVIIFRVAEYVVVHKVYSSDQRIRINY